MMKMEVGIKQSIAAVVASAIDVTPVVHGYWKGYTTSAFYGCDDYGDPIYRDVTIYYCSLCHRKSVIKERFCPNCGAKMDGKF